MSVAVPLPFKWLSLFPVAPLSPIPIKSYVSRVVPEVVLTADDEMQTKSVDYGKLTALLIESVKELGKVVNNEMQDLKKEIATLNAIVQINKED